MIMERIICSGKNMNREVLALLETKPYYKKIEKYLKREDPPSQVRLNLEKEGLSAELAHNIVKKLWDLKNSFKPSWKSLVTSSIVVEGAAFAKTFDLHLCDLAGLYASAVFKFRDMHTHVSGSEFYTLHELCQSLYEKVEEFYDDVCELAINFNETVPPMNVLPADDSTMLDYSGDSVRHSIEDILKDLLDTSRNLVKGYPDYVYSKRDSYCEFFDKELYKITQANK